MSEETKEEVTTTEETKAEEVKAGKKAEETAETTADESTKTETEVTAAAEEKETEKVEATEETPAEPESAPEDSQETEAAQAPKAPEQKQNIPVFTGEKSKKVYTLDELQEASEDYSDSEYDDMVKMYEGTLTSITEKEIVTGRIVSLDDKYVIVDIGFKSEGIVPLNEFKSSEEIKPGDEIEVFLDRVEDREGQLVLSRRKADTLRVWQKIEEVHETQQVIEGHIKRRIKGGMVVDVFGIDAFLPGSQIDVRPVRDFDAYVDRTMEFLVVKLNMSSENVVVSHRALVETDLEDQRQEILSTMEAGQILEGVVKNITDFGVFIDLGGVDGLLHITDLSWGRVEHPSEICKLDQRLNVVVLEFDEERKRISLGLKQLQPHPWDDIDNKYPENQKVQGKVVSIADYGAFIELEKGVEGLVHISEMSWTQHIKHPSQLVEKNQVIECVILNINKDEKKVSLGVKQLESDPWQEITKRYPINSQHKGVVRNLTNFGVFVELEPGIDGLVHISDLSWTEKVSHPTDVVNKGDEIDVVILSVDFDNRRISLGHKQITENPWDKFSDDYQLGAEVEGTVSRITDKGAFVELPHNLEGFFPAKESETPDKFKDNVKEGDKVTLNILEIDEQSRNITLSEKEASRKKAQEELKKYKKKKEQQELSGALTLGEMSGLSDLKELNEKEEKKKEDKKAAKAKKDEEEAAKAKAESKKAEAKDDSEVKEEKPKAKKKTKAKAESDDTESEEKADDEADSTKAKKSSGKAAKAEKEDAADEADSDKDEKSDDK
jgi:small subunit ribosomal protein S1